MLLLLVAGAVQTLRAQQSVTAGNQVTSESSIVSGKAYILKTGADRYITDNGTNYDVPNSANAATEASVYYLVSNGDGTWKIKNLYTNKYWGVPVYNTALTSVDEASAGAWSLNFSSGVAYPSCPDANATVRGIDRSSQKVWSWTTGTNANHQVYIYEIGLNTTDVYTLNCTTATNRGALVYDGSSTNVEAIASASLDATNANHQWVFYYTGTPGQYYLYNVGAGKFAIPTAIAQGSGNPWVFSSNAVAVTLLKQSDGTYRIKAAKDPVSGTNVAVISINRSSGNHVFNYNDAGSDFIITKVDGADQSTAAQAAVAKLVGSQTALTSFPNTSGWYVIQIKSKNGAASYAGRYMKPSTTLYNSLYPLTFTGAIDEQPAIDDVTYYTYINHTSWDVNTWQMPDGRYLVDNGSNKFPTASNTAGNVICGYSNGNYFKTSNNYYADPYNSNANYFIGETNSMRTAYTVYPIDLAEAGLTAWQVTINGASESTQLTCTRSDVKGLTSVYNNGFFFLPTGVTPTESDFTLAGMISCTVDAANHTITAEFDPTLALLADGVSVTRGYQTTGQGNTNALLLRVDLTPFNDMTTATLNFSLDEATRTNITDLYVYETTATEFIANIPTIPLATTSTPGSSVSLDLGAVTSGTHHYWLCASISNEATLGSILTPALTSVSYTTTEAKELDVSSIGNPSRQGMKVFAQQNFVFKPTTDNCRYYRIPAMILDKDGNIVVCVDKRYNSNSDLGNHKIDVVSVRSTDRGQTWSTPVMVAEGDGTNAATYGYGDAALTRATDGTLVCIMAAGNTMYGYGQVNAGISTSKDNGATWSTVRSLYASNFTDKVNNMTNGMGFTNMFTTSGKGLTTSDGTLMYTTNVRVSGNNTNYCYILYSTDNGENWTVDNQRAYSGTDESKLEQLADGSLLLSVRQSGNRGWNTATFTKNNDGTVDYTWGTQYRTSDINGNACNGDIINYGRETGIGQDVLIHSYINSSDRQSLQLAMSIDEGQTWKSIYNIQPNGSCYSTMQVLADGTLAILFEDESYSAGNGYAINYLTITPEQIQTWYEDVKEQTYSPMVTIIDTGITNGSAPYGTWSPTSGWANQFTTNAASGLAGVVVSSTYNAFNRETGYGQRVFCLKPSAAGAQNDIVTITAPEGYVIDGYSIGGFFYTSSEKNYTLTAEDGTNVKVNKNSGTPDYLTTSGLNAKSTTITLSNSNTTNNRYADITHFTVTLKSAPNVALTACNGMSYATLYLPYSYELSGDAKAYIINSIDNDKAILSELGQEVPSLTPVVLRSETAAASTQTTYKSSVTADATGNQLQGITMTQHVDGYVLNIKNNEPGFYKLSDTGRLAANRAYLPSSVVGELGVKGLILQWTDADGIEGVQSSEQGVMVNGKWLNGECYDLSGRRIQKPTRGLYIVGGRKVIVK